MVLKVTVLSYRHKRKDFDSRAEKEPCYESRMEIIKISNPHIVSGEYDDMRITGRVYVISSAELVRRFKGSYRTKGCVNRFPKIVEDYLSRKISSLEGLEVEDEDQALRELKILHEVLRDRKGIAVLRRLSPLELVENYSIGDSIWARIALREIAVPAIIEGNGCLSWVADLSKRESKDDYGNLTVAIDAVDAASAKEKACSLQPTIASVLSVFLMIVGIIVIALVPGWVQNLGAASLILGIVLLVLSLAEEMRERELLGLENGPGQKVSLNLRVLLKDPIIGKE